MIIGSMDEEIRQDFLNYLIHRARRLHRQGKMTKERRDQLIKMYQSGEFPGIAFIDTSDNFKPR